MPINSGQLDRRIKLQTRAAGIDGRGQPNGAWVDTATVWAQPMPAKGREYFAAGAMQDESSMAWRIRNRAGVEPTMRLLEGTVAYDIQAVIQSPSREWLDLYCLTGIRDGR